MMHSQRCVSQRTSGAGKGFAAARNVAARSAGTAEILRPITTVGRSTLQGTSRTRNEDRIDVQWYSQSGLSLATQQIRAPRTVRRRFLGHCKKEVGQLGDTLHGMQMASTVPKDGSISAFAAVYDGHGGFATAEWLRSNLYGVISSEWQGGNAPTKCINKAFREADKTLLAPTGFLNMGERGVGGSKCGSTAATASVWQAADGKAYLMAANVGDARVLLARDGKCLQLTTDHVPDSEEERKRIESMNPNPKLPLVRYVGDTWRVGGLLALSRAFGDAYLKGSLQFEGISAGSDGYASGFGLIAEPDVQIQEISASDSWVVVCSDGLFANEERGGGGGLENQRIIDICMLSGKKNVSPDAIAAELCKAAVASGSTDDVTCIVFKLGA